MVLLAILESWEPRDRWILMDGKKPLTEIIEVEEAREEGRESRKGT